MLRKKECVAMLLAGGQGSRLYTLTKKLAKPAVYFGGKYRIIDFPLSNCVNSGIDTVGVLTQYQPLELNDYIGNGSPWDLDRNYGGVHVLPPYQKSKGGDWYKGTANAIYQNLHFIDRYDPEYVIVLSGDHIYKMDYNKMLEFHKEKGADATIAVLNVSLKEASRFGIMNTDDTERILEFEEKPKQPKSTKASMGIYIFNKDSLEKYLTEDDADPKSSNDFGKNIIPKMIADGMKLYAYPFSGYWKDVGTIQSLWEANMDLLGDNPVLDLSDPDWKIYFKHIPQHPQYVGEKADIRNSIVSEGSDIKGKVLNSVIFSGVSVEEGASVIDSVIMPGVTIKAGAKVEYSIVDADAVIGKKAVIGESRESAKGIAVIGSDIKISDGTKVAAADMVEEDR
ncbi:MAG: glucose-1-phosphate adenylyltransferase [Catonella sp.]|jgi:glucose-1-phosphate adenylyltransferase|nr:glucose-1-phosphate adenylyltransferase [Catonella sp.]